jgi:phytoene dehydrogenase-like protein
MSYDAIIIGAGINGLAAAHHLATRGWRTLVVEARDAPGGAVKTAEVTLPGFRHDLGAMNLSMFAGSPYFAAHREELQAHGLGLVPAPNCFASVFRDGSYLGIGADAERNAAAIAALSPDDAAAWQAMAEEFGRDAPLIFALLAAPMPSWAAAKAVWTSWRAGGTAALYALGRLLLASPRAFLDARFGDPKVKATLAAWGLHLDFPPDMPGGALFPYVEAMANQSFGMVIGDGGADSVISAMTSALAARGGELLLDAPVARLAIADGRARGVVLANGRTIEARRAVIANVHPRLLFDRLVAGEEIPRSFRDKVDAFRPGPGTMMIHLALSGLPDWKGGDALKQYAYVHIAPELDMMGRVYAEATAGLLPAEPALVVGQPTAIDPKRAPPGRHVLWVQVRVLPSEIRGDAAGTIAARSWDEAKQAYAERVVDIIERYAPGLRAKILAQAIYSPADLERENVNLIGGDSLSGSHHLDQNFLFRPVAGYSRYATPIAGLYMCGASTWPGAGTAAGSGFILAKMLGR